MVDAEVLAAVLADAEVEVMASDVDDSDEVDAAALSEELLSVLVAVPV